MLKRKKLLDDANDLTKEPVTVRLLFRIQIEFNSIKPRKILRSGKEQTFCNSSKRN
jgi:hypothetical protein